MQYSIVLYLHVLIQVFTHVTEYLGRDCLDLLVCVDVAATAVEGAPEALSATGDGAAAPPSTMGSRSLQQKDPALQLSLAGAALGGVQGAAAGGTGGSTGAGDACCYIINDVNLLTVLDTIRLLIDFSS